MLSLRGARAGGMLGTGARVGAVVTLGVLLASVVIDGARPTPQWLCDKVMEAIAMDDTMDADEFECKGSGMPAGHLLEVYEGEFKGADYSTCESFFFGFESLPCCCPLRTCGPARHAEACTCSVCCTSSWAWPSLPTCS